MINRASRRTVTRAVLGTVYAAFAAGLCLGTLGGTPSVFHGLVTVPLALLGVAAALVALEHFLDRPAAARARRRGSRPPRAARRRRRPRAAGTGSSRARSHAEDRARR